MSTSKLNRIALPPSLPCVGVFVSTGLAVGRGSSRPQHQRKPLAVVSLGGGCVSGPHRVTPSGGVTSNNCFSQSLSLLAQGSPCSAGLPITQRFSISVSLVAMGGRGRPAHRWVLHTVFKPQEPVRIAHPVMLRVMQEGGSQLSARLIKCLDPCHSLSARQQRLLWSQTDTCPRALYQGGPQFACRPPLKMLKRKMPLAASLTVAQR